MTIPAGRFAPSPTGPLHMGSLLAATASYLDAHSRKERWLVRIDDLDTPRTVPGAEASILAALEAHGLHWDGPVAHQTSHTDAYTAALERLIQQEQVFFCRCSRSQLPENRPYPGTCRERTAPSPDAAIRVRVPDQPVEFIDLIVGPHIENLARTTGDFVVRRRDGLVAYQLATAVDDGSGQIRRVVRGRDLLDNTPRQIYLMSLLGLQVPDYAHVPTLRNAAGQKLSKQAHAPSLDISKASANLATVFDYLGLRPPKEASHWPVAILLQWGVEHWSLDLVPRSDIYEHPTDGISR